MSRLILCFIFTVGALTVFSQRAKTKKNFVTVSFQNVAGGKKIFLNDSLYSNAFGEKYSVSKLKYYVSNFRFITSRKEASTGTMFLIDEARGKSFEVLRPAAGIDGVEFLLGVDSALNCSGAQSGALDPLNDMFWTWNSGYVMFKMEGSSENSKADNQRIEEHIGGYKGEFKTMRPIRILFSKKNIEHNNIVVQMDLDKFWAGAGNIRITETPVITTVSAAARRAADNFPGMFSLKE